MKIDAVILAGGQSRRMGGGDKALLRIAGRPMLAHIIERLSPQVGRIAINANGDPARFADFGLPVIADTFGSFDGPLAGILTAMRWASDNDSTAGHVLTVPADAPLMPADLADRLIAAIDDAPDTIALAASDGRRHPVAGLWPCALARDLSDGLDAGIRKVMQWAGRHSLVTVDFPLSETPLGTIDPFFNANTPDDLAEIERVLAASGS